MAIQGLRDTSNFITNARPENWREGILLLEPNGKMPLLGLTSLMKKRSVDDSKFHWFEKVLDDQRYQLHATSGDLTTSNTTITLASGENGKTLKEGDILYVEETGEQLLVTQDPASDTSLTVERGFAGTTATAVDANGAGVNPYLLKIGSVYEEGSLAPTGIAFDPTEYWNYTQIFRDTLEATRTAMKTRLRTGDAVKEAKRECLQYHGIGIERSMWLGTRASGTKNGKPYHTMNGVVNQVDSNNVVDVNSDYATGLTLAGLEEYMYEIFKYGSSEKMAFCGNRALLTLQQVVRKNTSMQIFSGIKEFGMNVMRLDSPFGSLVLKSHPLWNQVAGGTNGGSAYYGMESWLIALDMENVKYVYFNGADTHYEPDLQQNGMDGMKSGYLTECSIELHHGKTHYVLKNIVKAAADA